MNIGDTVYVVFFQMGTVAPHIYEGDNIDRADHYLLRTNRGELRSVPKKDTYTDEHEASLILYKYKLPILQKKIEEHKKNLDKVSTELAQLKEQFSYLKEKFPEEFI